MASSRIVRRFAAILGLLVAAGGPHVGLSHAEPPVWSYEWYADGIQGSLGIRFTIDVVEPGRCFTYGAGLTRGGAEMHMILDRELDHGPLELRGAQGVVHYAQVHASAIDVRPAYNEIIYSVFSDEDQPLVSDEAEVEATVTYLMVVQSLDPTTNGSSGLTKGHTFLLHAECDVAAAIHSFEAGRKAFVFEGGSEFSGGVGAGAITPAGSATASAIDKITFDSGAESVRLHAFDAATASVGTFRIDGPTAARSWAVGSINDAQAFQFTGEPGAYEATLTRAAAGLEFFVGSFTALRPVGSPDEIL